jgi:hypothetical protein
MLMLGIFACNKVNQWKQPLEICFVIEPISVSSNSVLLDFQEVNLHLHRFNFDAKRAQGADVYFTKQYSNDASVAFDATCNSDLKFEIPQGTYADINIKITSKQEQGPGIQLVAQFNHNNQKIPFQLELSKLEDIQLVGVDQQGNEANLNLENRDRVEARIQLLAENWFDGISTAMLEEAQTLDSNGQASIFIGSDANVNLYNQIRSNMQLNQQIAILEL